MRAFTEILVNTERYYTNMTSQVLAEEDDHDKITAKPMSK